MAPSVDSVKDTVNNAKDAVKDQVKQALPVHQPVNWATDSTALTRSTIGSPEEDRRRREHKYHEIMWNGTVYSAAAATGTGAAIYGLSKRFPFWKSLNLPIKTFFTLAAGTATFFTYVDKASISAAREEALPRSVSGPLSDSAFDKIPRQFQTDEDIKKWQQNRTVKHWIVEHRYPLVAGLWAGTLGGSILYNMRRTDILPANKVINARLAAQVLALVGVGAGAALATTEPHEKQVDRHFQRVISGEKLVPGEGQVRQKDFSEHRKQVQHA
ncbi:hypothetical protein HK097_011559 [Rhizophlyctis rosea]|uniref:HIG1 domain-containing protein n=1 Tax=Rhizophlyctis rosea TaxID=64517 RepID=A0AAD5S8V8_9FUNG|nr:hypothetical protein HK097_011559 [Rhizophlyctis rosea]